VRAAAPQKRRVRVVVSLGWKHEHVVLSRAPDTGSAAFPLPKTEPLAGHQRLCMHHPEEYPVEFLPLALTCRWPLGGPGPSAQGALKQSKATPGLQRPQEFLFYRHPRNKIAPERGHEEAERPPTRASKNRKPRPGEAGLRAEGRGRVGGHVHSVWRQRDTPMTRSPVISCGGARPSLLRPPASSLEQPGSSS
jgi:hypothetical protein